MEQKLIISKHNKNQRQCINRRWLSLYNKFVWILCDILRTVVVIATIIAFHDSIKYIVFTSIGLFLLLFGVFFFVNTSQQSSFCACRIPLLIIIYLFQHLRFHDYLVHIDRDTHYVGFLEVLGFVQRKTDHVTAYILKDNNMDTIRRRIVASNYYILSTFKDSLEGTNNTPKIQLLIEYIATIHNKNIYNKFDKYYDIKWLDIRNSLDQNILKKNKKRLFQVMLLGIYILISFLIMFCSFIALWYIHNDAVSYHTQFGPYNSALFLTYVIYFVLEIYIIIVEVKHGKFAFYFYHLLTSIQPLQTNRLLEWNAISIDSIEMIYDIMYEYQQMNYSLVIECGFHPNIAQIICLYLVYKLPENGDIDQVHLILYYIHQSKKGTADTFEETLITTCIIR